ncbi:MAG: hypothetical protein GIW94_12360 [Candidatus Eremiobacteraeota bacterium]|nr:hypothetical protein [Candidatus Eremiobacteraeota bacterium]MBC5822497.1 hypothetical protein [Candidatus Eremiobacteraeota bacterium]
MWLTAVANSLLQLTRGTVGGIHIGSYGWVENVKPSTGRASFSGAERERPSQEQIAEFLGVAIALRRRRVPRFPFGHRVP